MSNPAAPANSILTHLRAELGVEEARRKFLYDDETGKTLVKGSVLEGNISGGIGINFSIGLDDEEIAWLFDHRAQKVLTQLAAFDWYALQDDVRQAVLADITFNIGLNGLLHWPQFLGYMAIKDYPNAVRAIQTNEIWIAEVGARASRLEKMLFTGDWPSDIKVAG